jgi:hypothetical protein
VKAITGFRIGVSIGHGRVGAVAMKAWRVVAFAESAMSSERELAGALQHCLGSISNRTLGPRIPVHVALEPRYVQVARLTGIPVLTSREQLHALAHLARTETFIGQAGELCVFVGEQEDDGGLWVLATQTALVQQISAVMSAAGTTLVRILPSLDVLAAAGDTVSGTYVRADGPDLVGCVQLDAGRITKAWRALKAGGESCAALPEPPSLLAMRGPIPEVGVPRFSVAIAAALPLTRSRFEHPSMLSIPARRSVGRQLRREVAVAAALTAAAIVAPGVRDFRAAEQASRTIDAIQADYRADAPRRAGLDSLRSLHSAIARFRASGAPTLSLMRALGEALTADAVITSLAVDSAGAQVTLLATSAGDVVQRLGAMRGVDSVALTGAISRERIVNGAGLVASGLFGAGVAADSAREMERAALRVFSVRAPLLDERKVVPGRDAGRGLVARASSGRRDAQ